MHVSQSTAIARIRMQEAHEAARADARTFTPSAFRQRHHPRRWTAPLAAASVVLAAGLLLGSLPALSRVEAGAALETPRPMAAPAPGH